MTFFFSHYDSKLNKIHVLCVNMCILVQITGLTDWNYLLLTD